jgi:hypothetical protein
VPVMIELCECLRIGPLRPDGGRRRNAAPGEGVHARPGAALRGLLARRPARGGRGRRAVARAGRRRVQTLPGPGGGAVAARGWRSQRRDRSGRRRGDRHDAGATPLQRISGETRWGGGHTANHVSRLQFSPDGARLAVVDVLGASLWTPAGDRVETIVEPRFGVSSVAFSPDGKQLVTSEFSGVYLRDAATLQPRRSISIPPPAARPWPSRTTAGGSP